MSSGLTRRRGGGGGGGGADNENGESSRVASPVPKAGASRDTSGPETSYESGENGHKIAFDPRDISESAERSKQPKLTLMEEVLLLGLKDKQVSARKGSLYYHIHSRLIRHRDISHFGTTTSHTLCGDAL
jgi:Golgi phosphoprotein 3